MPFPIFGSDKDKMGKARQSALFALRFDTGGGHIIAPRQETAAVKPTPPVQYLLSKSGENCRYVAPFIPSALQETYQCYLPLYLSRVHAR